MFSACDHGKKIDGPVEQRLIGYWVLGEIPQSVSDKLRINYPTIQPGFELTTNQTVIATNLLRFTEDNVFEVFSDFGTWSVETGVQSGKSDVLMAFGDHQFSLRLALIERGGTLALRDIADLNMARYVFYTRKPPQPAIRLHN